MTLSENPIPSGYELRLVGPEHIDEIGILRAYVWSLHSAFSKSLLDNSGRFLDKWEVQSYHFAIFLSDSKTIVASARLTIGENPTEVPYAQVLEDAGHKFSYPLAVISRLVVHPDHRGRGLSKLLDNVRLQCAREKGSKVIVGISFTREDALINLGFEPHFRLSSEEISALAGLQSESTTCYLFRFR